MSGKDKENFWKYSLITIILVLGGIIFYQTLPFLSGVMGACTIYLLVRNQMKYLTGKKKMKSGIASVLILLEVILIFVVPLTIALWLLTNRIGQIDLQPASLVTDIQHFITLLHTKFSYDLLSNDNISMLTSKLTSMAQYIINQVSSFTINCVVMIFVLYFMLMGGRRMEAYAYDVLPFNTTNKGKIINATKRMVISNAIGIPLLAIIQGFIATIGYYIAGTPDPVLFGFLTCFATIIPLIGTALVWVPLSLYMILTGQVASGIGLILYAVIIISNIDNVIRFMLQKKLADTHPLVTIFGVIMGLSLFGFWGVIFGPLLFSIFLVCFDIFKHDYIDADN